MLSLHLSQTDHPKAGGKLTTHVLAGEVNGMVRRFYPTVKLGYKERTEEGVPWSYSRWVLIWGKRRFIW
jgi:hypothetical protein